MGWCLYAVAVDQLANAQWGLGFRAGPLYIASQDIFSTLIKMKKGNARDINIQMGLKVSIPHLKAKDKDKDGVSNKKTFVQMQKELANQKVALTAMVMASWILKINVRMLLV